jgi:hypothetical protein
VHDDGSLGYGGPEVGVDSTAPRSLPQPPTPLLCRSVLRVAVACDRVVAMLSDIVRGIRGYVFIIIIALLCWMWLLCHTDHHRHPLAPPPLTDYGFVCASGCCLVHGMPLTACQSIVLGGVWPHVRRVVRMGCSLPSPDRTAVTHDRPPLPGLSFVLFCVLCLFWEPILCNPIYRVSLALSPVPHALHHLVERPALVLISIAMMARMAGRGARSCGWRCAWVTKLKLCFPSC